MKEKLFYVLLGAALFMAGALLHPGIGTKAEAASEIQRWEYYIEGFSGETVNSGCAIKGMSDWILKNLGEKGYELVAVVERYDDESASCYHDYIFKRPM